MEKRTFLRVEKRTLGLEMDKRKRIQSQNRNKYQIKNRSNGYRTTE